MKREKSMKGKLACVILAMLMAVGFFPAQVQASEAGDPGTGSPEVIATVDGVEITTEHMRDNILDLDMTGVPITEANMEIIVEDFLGWADQDADRNTGFSEYQIFFFYGGVELEDRNDDLKIVVNETAAQYLKSLQQKGKDFKINMGTENGGAVLYSKIEGATTLGFATHGYLDNAHWDFYGCGFNFQILEFPYDKPGAVQLLYQAGNGMMGKSDISNTYDPEYNEINIIDPLHITYPGLHFLVPKDTVSAENMITISSSTTQEELKDILSSSAGTLEGEVTVALGAAENQVVDSSVFSQVANRKDVVTVLTLKHNNIIYEIAATGIDKPDISMTLGASENTTAVKQIVAEAEYAVDFAHSGDLPGKTKVTIPVTGIADGDYFWSYLDNNNRLVESQAVKVDKGNIQATITHCSTYVLTKEEPSTGNGQGNDSDANTESGSNNGPDSTGSETNDSDLTGNKSSSKESAALTNVPQTGDDFPMGMLCAAALISGAGFAYAKKRETN